jgi:hypothetical protein
MANTDLADNSPNADDSPDFWEHNEYQALKMMFEGAAYHLRAREDPEVHARLKEDAQRLRELENKFRPRHDR